MHNLSDSDKGYLDTLGYNINFIKANIESTNLKERRDLRRIKEAIIFHKEVYQTNSISAICLVSGQQLNTNISLCPRLEGFYAYAYYFSGEKSFNLLVGDYWGEKLGIYVPEDNLILQFQKVSFNLKLYISFFRAFCIRYKKRIAEYKSNTQKLHGIAVYHTHFAHHLWTELSGIYEYLQNLSDNSLKKIYVLENPLGSIKKIFPNLSSSVIENIKPESLSLRVLKDNLFIVPAKSVVIQEKLIDKIYNYYQENQTFKSKAAIEQFSKDNRLKLWISVRKNSRTWINQEEGIANIINALGEKYGRMGIVFDGFTIPFDVEKFNTKKYRKLIASEIKLIKEIQSNFKLEHNITILSGKKIDEVLLWAKCIDLYFVHHGTIQHKVGWLANKPGVVHCNTLILNKNEYSRPGIKERQNGIIPKYIESSYVNDIDEPVYVRKGQWIKGEYINYNFDWKVAYIELEKLVDQGIV